jgi:NitT/TauT family transport system substrate-binding protein
MLRGYRRSGLLPLAVSSLLALAACAPQSGPAASSKAAAPSGAPAAPAGPTAPAAAAPPAAQGPPPAPTHLRMAYQRLAVDVGFYVAEARGYLAQEGIDLEQIYFANGSEAMPALATGQLEIGGGAANPATFNAIARGIPLKAVADRGTFRPGSPGDQSIVVRKEVWDRGQGRRLEDLKDLTLGVVSPGKGTTSGCALSAGLQRVGLTLDDMHIEGLSFADMVGALANGAVDAAMISEPFTSRARRQGTIVRLMGVEDLYPNFTLTTLGLHEDLYKNRPVAKGLIRAYVRGIRDYLDARAGRTSDADRAQVEDVIAHATNLDAATVHEMDPPNFSPNGLPNKESMYYCYQFFRDLGLVPQPIPDATFANLWGTDLVEEVLNDIGRRPED